jgi:hypothetical protein
MVCLIHSKVTSKNSKISSNPSKTSSTKTFSPFKKSLNRRSCKFKSIKSRMARSIYSGKSSKITNRDRIMLLMQPTIASINQINLSLHIKIQMRKKKRAIRILITKTNLKFLPSGLISLALICLMSQK